MLVILASIVARDRISENHCCCKEANMMQGKTHENIKTNKTAMKDGVITSDVSRENDQYV
jgi:actin-like ATPase involved in cell morphogenesis